MHQEDKVLIDICALNIGTPKHKSNINNPKQR